MDEGSRLQLAFGDALARFDTGAIVAADLVDAAVALLVSGADTPGLVDLASFPVTRAVSWFELRSVVDAARTELGLSELHGDAAIIRATQGVARRWLAGQMSDTEFTRWAHDVVGHDGPSQIKRLADLDDVLDGVGTWSTMTADDMHSEIERVVLEVLALPDPWA